VLHFVGLRAAEGEGPGDYLPTTLDKDDLVRAAEGVLAAPPARRPGLLEGLPDAIFLIESLPSDVAQVLVRAADYRLVGLPFAEGFSLAEFNDAATATTRLEPRLTRPTRVPPYLYQVTPAVPGRGCQTLGTSLLLVAHKDLPGDAVFGMLKVIHDRPFAALAHLQSPCGTAPEYPLHAGAAAFRDRDQPVVPKELLDVLAKLVSLWVFLSATCYAASRYFRRDPARRFAHYLQEFTRLDLVARGIADDPEAPGDPAARVAYLEDKLSRLKAAMIQEFSDTQLYREGALGTVLALVCDTRASLHAQRAKLEGLPSPASDCRHSGCDGW
jgi:hypothetical protein